MSHCRVERHPPLICIDHQTEQTPGFSLRSVRRQKAATTKYEGESHPGVAIPPSVRSFKPTDIPSLDPSIPPPGRRDRVRNHTAPQRPTLTERESNRLGLWPPETFPRSARRIREDRRSKERRTGLIQTWTSTVYGLEEDVQTQIPHLGICKVSTIQCSICATHRIPALHFCYRCFPDIAVNQIITTTTNGDTMDLEYKICFTKRSKSTEMRQHRFSAHLPQEHVDYRYPFSQTNLGVIASRDEDRYNQEVCPRTLPLRDGICIPQESLLNDPDGAAGLN